MAGVSKFILNKPSKLLNSTAVFICNSVVISTRVVETLILLVVIFAFASKSSAEFEIEADVALKSVLALASNPAVPASKAAA